jgi:hypothetical protein
MSNDQTAPPTSASGGELPAAVARLAHAIAGMLRMPVSALFIEDNPREGLGSSVYTIAYEADGEWPGRFVTAVERGEAQAPAGWFLVPGASWYLAAYQETDA